MNYTVCEKVVQNSKKLNISTNLLFHFSSPNNCKVVYNTQILDHYQNYSCDIVNSWLRLMDFNESWKRINDFQSSTNDIFIKACNLTYDKKLIVNEKEDYPESKYEGLDLMDKDEAYYELNTSQVINVQGNNTTFTTGEGSDISIESRDS